MEDVIAVIHNTLRGVPIDLRELVLDERDNGDALRRRMQAGDISVDENLTRYHDEYRRSFRESDSGRRFEDAFQVIITDEGRQQIDEALRAIAKTPYLAGESGVLLGQIRDELARIYDGVTCSDKLRVCFDTCHTSDSGYDIIHDFDGVIEKFDRLIGKDQIAVFHINDSKNPAGASKDRHANIGFGQIGFEALNYIVHHPDFQDVPKILETPYVPSPTQAKKSFAPYKYEIEMLRQKTFDPDLLEKIAGV